MNINSLFHFFLLFTSIYENLFPTLENDQNEVMVHIKNIHQLFLTFRKFELSHTHMYVRTIRLICTIQVLYQNPLFSIF